MGIANEIEFENELCAYLAAHGWLYTKSNVGYDAPRALYAPDLLAYIQETQSEVWKGFAAFHGAAAEGELLKRLEKSLVTHGTLHVLRHELKVTGAGSAGFFLVRFRPAAGFNQQIAEEYGKVRLRVMRQVHYSTQHQNSLDLVFFVNGIPVATAELKTDFTQAVEDAKQQYRKDRPPRDAATRKEEPLLTFKRGALVHFAVSTEEVWMTTRLAEDTTFFLPFNKGNAGRKGNPPNPEGYDTAYLWEEVLQRDMWLRILGYFVQLEKKIVTSATGVRTTRESLVFPRYHQLDAVTRLVDAARAEGPGHSYLLQHSAGSGKSNTISWTAHQLSTLHDSQDKKVFDSVLVITDRTVLDSQLKETIAQVEAAPGVVATIDANRGAKSGQLTAALKAGAMIIVVTLQTFPHVLKEIRSSHALADRSFAVIIDEAHSSQSGSSARKLRGALAADTGEDDAEEVAAADLLADEVASRRLPPNVSFLAFTATPKSKTVEVFGRRPDPAQPAGEGNLPQPFHLYTMKQAIQEGFILDVLRNFTPYRLAYKLAHDGKDWDDRVMDKAEGLKALAGWVKLHPYNIAQKVEIVVEHFRANVGFRLEGRAKAMVVTGSRREAVRYKLATDAYIQRCGYTDVAALVAFSGDVTDPESGPEKFNESTMNPALHGQDLRDAFATDAYQVLIVANKFQTGFDQPLLVAMYVDKRLDGITAVQTLSRLNRTYPGKDTTYVLDFRNDAETIRKAFEPYYETTELLATTDPDLVYELQTRLDCEQIYTEQEARLVAEIFLLHQSGSAKKSQKELLAALKAPVERFKVRWQDAEAAPDREELDRLTTFHRNLDTFCRLYDFLSQIVNYDDTSLELRYIFYKHLEPLVRPDRVRQAIDLTGVQLSHYKLHAGKKTSVALGAEEDEERRLKPITAVGSHTIRTPEEVKLAELIQKLNDLFDDGSLTDADRVGLFEHVAGKMQENEELCRQARANSKDQFQQSPTIGRVVLEAVIAAMDSYEAMGKKVFQDQAAMGRFQALLVDYVYDQVRNQPPAGG